MLAPRKVLWSTPQPVIDVAFQWIRDIYQNNDDHQQHHLQSDQDDDDDDDGVSNKEQHLQQNDEQKNTTNSLSSATLNTNNSNSINDQIHIIDSGNDHEKIDEAVNHSALSSSSKFVMCDVGCGDGRVLIEWMKQFTLLLNNNNSSTFKRNYDPIQFIGIDIDPIRIQIAKEEAKNTAVILNRNTNHHMNEKTPYYEEDDQAVEEKDSDERSIYSTNNQCIMKMRIHFYVCNGLECNHYIKNANVIFLYLIPRGLRQFYKLMLLPLIMYRKKQQSIMQQQQKRSSFNKSRENDNDDTNMTTTTLLTVITYMAQLPFDDHEMINSIPTQNMNNNHSITTTTILSLSEEVDEQKYDDDDDTIILIRKRKENVVAQAGSSWPLYCYQFILKKKQSSIGK